MATTKFLIATVASVGTAGGAGSLLYFYGTTSSLKQELISNSLTPLSKSNESHKTFWNDLAKKYAKDSQEKKLGDLELTFKSENKELNEGELVKFQDACEALFNKKKNEKDYESSLELAKEWCTEQAAKKIAPSEGLGVGG